jgi:hypothetical protein
MVHLVECSENQYFLGYQLKTWVLLGILGSDIAAGNTLNTVNSGSVPCMKRLDSGAHENAAQAQLACARGNNEQERRGRTGMVARCPG